MSERSEFKRGYKAGKEEMDKYRSFKVKDGVIFAYYKETGGLHNFGKKKYWSSTRGFDGGYSKAVRDALKERPTKSKKAKDTFGMKDSFGMKGMTRGKMW
jgi:hypothetical protein